MVLNRPSFCALFLLLAPLVLSGWILRNLRFSQVSSIPIVDSWRSRHTFAWNASHFGLEMRIVWRCFHLAPVVFLINLIKLRSFKDGFFLRNSLLLLWKVLLLHSLSSFWNFVDNADVRHGSMLELSLLLRLLPLNVHCSRFGLQYLVSWLRSRSNYLPMRLIRSLFIFEYLLLASLELSDLIQSLLWNFNLLIDWIHMVNLFLHRSLLQMIRSNWFWWSSRNWSFRCQYLVYVCWRILVGLLWFLNRCKFILSCDRLVRIYRHLFTLISIFYRCWLQTTRIKLNLITS